MEIKTFLTSNGWQYIGQTCGCGGSPKLDQYKKEGKRLNVDLRKEQYKVHEYKFWSNYAPISQIFTDSRV